MTVLEVCAYAAPYEGNFIESLKALASELKTRGHRSVFAFPESAKSITWVEELGKTFDVFFLPLAKARIKPETYIALHRIYQQYDDLAVIHSHFELYDVPVSMTAPGHVKVFWHLHDALEMYSSFRNRTIHRAQYGLFHRNARLLSVSEKHMRYVLRCGFPAVQAGLVPNGIDTERIRIVSNAFEDKEYDFLMFGWEFERKGVDLCIEAMHTKRLACRVAVVGTAETKRIIRERYGEVSGVEVIEPVTDINELYNNTRCFLHISRAEGLSYALLEAVYAGLPVICSDISENRFAERFSTVRMIRAENTDEIGEAMQTILERPGNSKEEISAARKTIEDEFSISCWVKKILDEYQLP